MSLLGFVSSTTQGHPPKVAARLQAPDLRAAVCGDACVIAAEIDDENRDCPTSVLVPGVRQALPAAASASSRHSNGKEVEGYTGAFGHSVKL